MNRARLPPAAGLCACLLAGAAAAQQSPPVAPASLASPASPTPGAPAPAPDKSGFTLFDPTPDADLRNLCTDRPTKSTSPCTVDAGHFQLESDLFNVTADREAGVTTTTWLATNPTLKLGLTNTLDIEVSMVPWQSVATRDRASGITTRASGVGDFYTRLKLSLIGDDGGVVGFGLVPYMKAPTAGDGVGNGAVEAGIVAPASVNLPAGFQLVIDPELDSLENAAGHGHHLNASGLLSLSLPASKTWTLSAEIWSDVNFEPAGRVTQVSADLGAAWIPAAHPTFQLDGGVNLGLNNRTPGVQAYVGVSRRF